MTARYIDDAGHAWPLTGRWCAQCGLPLHDAVQADVHPLCDPHPWEATP